MQRFVFSSPQWFRRLIAAAGWVVAASVYAVPAAGAAAAADGIPYPPENLVSTANQVEAARPDSKWTGLLEQLQAKGNIWATFTENRYLPFKKVPVVFTGELRHSKTHGLSLHYTSPEDRTMVVDTHGVLLRDDAGRTRELPADPRAQAATSTLLHVMRFDLDALSQSFRLYADGDPSQWHFGFEPKDENVSKTLNRLIVSGQNDDVRRIIMRKSALQRIEILIGEIKEGVTFSEEDLKKHFR